MVRVSGHGRSVDQHRSESRFRIDGYRLHHPGLVHVAMMMMVLWLLLLLVVMMMV